MHITEFSDLPPKPEAVLGKDGHIKPSFIEKLTDDKEKERLPIGQRMKVLEHNSGCAQCRDAIRKAKGELSPDSLPFEE